MVKDGEAIQAGDIIARKPRETSKTKDIVGGLPRVAELFEVRKPKDMAVVSEISGTVSYAGESKGKRKLVVTPEIGDSKEYLVPKGKHITVADGDFVEAGDPLTEGSPELHDILRTRGEKYLARYLVDEIQEVYRFQGVGIDDKHIEVIVRQMLKKVTVLDSGGTSFLVGEQVDKAEFKAENHKAIAEGRQPATAEPLVLGIPGFADHLVLHLGGFLPGNHQGAHRGFPQGQDGLPARPQGKRHRGPSHPGRYGLSRVCPRRHHRARPEGTSGQVPGRSGREPRAGGSGPVGPFLC